MYNLSARVKALEKSAAHPLPLFYIEYDDGTTRTVDALDVYLLKLKAEAGAIETNGIKEITRASGLYPAGTIWDELKNTEKGGKP